jgi:hypothetical protein
VSTIRSEHIACAAFFYVRQSSLKQVCENVESQRRQYGFAERALERRVRAKAGS